MMLKKTKSFSKKDYSSPNSKHCFLYGDHSFIHSLTHPSKSDAHVPV